MDDNILYTGDNLHIMNGMNSESVDLIYLDPPFNSKRAYSAPIGSKAAGATFNDIWTWDDVDEACLEKLYSTHPFLVRYIDSIRGIHSKAMASYITFMAQRIFEMHRILKSSGSLYLHCDSTASHYLKVTCDRVFGSENFMNEIIWVYGGGARGAKAISSKMPRNHDVILVYGKSKERTHNRIKADVMYPINDLPSHVRYDKEKKTAFKTSPRGDYTDESIEQLKKQGRVYTTRTGNIRIKYPLEIRDGHVVEPKLIGDSWTDIPDMMHVPKKERTGYPTQKPLALLNRIIQISSNESDVVLDPFCGCATACVSAQQLNRKWIGIDVEIMARELVARRLASSPSILFRNFIHLTKPQVRSDIIIVQLKRDKSKIKKELYEKQDNLCNGCGNEYLLKDLDIDHVLPKSKGGQDNIENLQLLCGHCNSIKGDRPMEYLRARLARTEALAEKISY